MRRTAYCPAPFRVASLAAALSFGCTSEPLFVCKPLPTECDGSPPSYAAEIAPIVQEHCNNCHGSNGLWAFETRDDLSDWRADVQKDVQDCTMPPPSEGTPLPDRARERLNAWLVCGAPNN